jgi:VanZ family protein/UDP-2,3-diacylglucosamine pyrophosphatase LpxH
MRRTWIWILPLAIAATGFWLSSQSALPLGIELPHPLDWFCHATEHACLAFTLDLAWRRSSPGTPVYRRHLAVFLLVGLFGLSDEIHQAFVPGRDCSLGDWLADLTGAVLGLAASGLPWLRTRRLAGLSWRRGALARPEPARPLVLVADPHWSRELTGLEPARRALPEADWLFLGDIFDVWVGVPGMDTPLEREFLEWVGERRREGRWVGFWLGNREYFLDPLSRRFDLMGEGIGGGLPLEGLRFEHGDLVNAADWRYRLWNVLSRSGPVWLFARLLPRAAARSLAVRIQRALHTTNRDYKLAFPREAFRAAAAEEPGRLFVTGHFHTHQVEANGTALPWAHDGGFMVWHQGRLQPFGGPGHPMPMEPDGEVL